MHCKKFETVRKENKIWFDNGSEFYNSFKKWSKKNDIEMYSTCNDGEFVVAESLLKFWKARFISLWQLFQKMSILMKNILNLR